MSLSSRVRPALSEWINHLLDAVQIRSRATFIELLCACLISPEGWVTRAISALQRRSHWTTYYWQQSVPALELWMQIRSMAWVLAQLLTLLVRDSFPIGQIAPWRGDHALTAGLIGQWLRIEFSGLPFRDGYDGKSRKFSFPKARFDPRTAAAAGQSP